MPDIIRDPFEKWQKIAVKETPEPRASFLKKQKFVGTVVVLTEYNISRAWDSHHPVAVETKMSGKKVPRPHHASYSGAGTKA